MSQPAGQDQYIRAFSKVVKLPGHLEFLGEFRKFEAEPIEVSARKGRLRMHAHEESGAISITELLALDDVQSALSQKARHCLNDSKAVGTRKCENDGGHTITLATYPVVPKCRSIFPNAVQKS